MKRQEVLFLFVSVFLVAVAWLAFTIIHNIRTSTISDVLSIQIIPINPFFDDETITALKNRQVITPLYQLQGNGISPTPSASSSSSAQLSPTPKGTITPTPQAVTPTIASPTAVPIVP